VQTVGDVELRVDAEQQRQHSQMLGILTVEQGRVVPCGAQTVRCVCRRHHVAGGLVMQKSSERLPAESFVRLRVEDEGMPCIVDDARWHRDEASARGEADLEPISQSALDQRDVGCAELGMRLAELVVNGRGKGVGFYEQVTFSVTARREGEQG